MLSLSMLTFLAAFAATPAVTVDSCHPWPKGEGSGILFVECDTTNASPAAVAALEYKIIGSQPGRTVPVIVDHSAADVSGGIEPGETRKVIFSGGPVSTQTLAIPGLTFSVEILKAKDVNGNRLP